MGGADQGGGAGWRVTTPFARGRSRRVTMRTTMIATVFACVLALPAPAVAQTWPTRPLTMMIPFTAGSSIDVAGRILAPRMAELLGQPIIIENQGGAGGMTGAARVAKAPPDGYL